MRRKTLRNTLKAKLMEQDFQTQGIDSNLRAENLRIADFMRIANYFQHLKRIRDRVLFIKPGLDCADDSLPSPNKE